MGSLPAGYAINPNDGGNVPAGVPALVPEALKQGEMYDTLYFPSSLVSPVQYKQRCTPVLGGLRPLPPGV